MTLFFLDPECIKWITKMELRLEFSVAIFCFICNIYFSVRFAQIPNFSPDLKTVFVILHLSKAFLAIIHPVAELFPSEWTDVENGYYFGAVLYYFLQYVFSICIYLISVEITVFVLERKIAIHQLYAKKQKYTGRQILWSLVAVICGCVLLKDGIMFLVYRHERPLKIMLDKVLVLEKFPPVFVTAYVSFVFSSAYGLVEFIRLRRFIQKHWYAGRTLAESIQIKQTGTLTRILMPIAISYFVTAIFASSCYFCSIYMHYSLGFSLYSSTLNAFTYAQYVFASLYNLFSTCYVIWLLRPMRKLMLQDLHRLLGIRRQSNRVRASIDWVGEREHHFEYLKAAWQ